VRTKLKWSASAVLALAAACSGSPTQPSGSPNVPPPPVVAGPAVVIAAGDVAWCDDLRGAERTAEILDRTPGTVLGLGDLAYMRGTFEQFRDCYGPTWGRHRGRTRPVPGNHEYESAGAGPYYQYFGESAGEFGDGYYAFRAGNWQVLALNSNISMDRGSPQYQWAQHELQSSDRCTLAYWHHPRFTSGPNGDNMRAAALWELLHAEGVEVVLAGHDHVYERYLPMNAAGQLDRERGVRQFIVGTGGALPYRFAAIKPNSAARFEGFGVLRLVLGDGRYDWEYLPTQPGFTDTGFDVCH